MIREVAAQNGTGPRRHGPGWLVAICTVAAFATVFFAYLTGLRLAIEPTDGIEPNATDGIYFGIHGASLVLSVILGFALGSYFRALGFAFAVLFLALMVMSMAGAQVATFELACRGHNDIIRHWRC